MEQTIDTITDPVSDPKSPGASRQPLAAPQSLAKLKPRWPFVLLSALLGAVLGFLLTSGPPTYESTAIVQLSESSEESTRVKQVAQTVERTATSSPVIEEAAEARGTDPEDLARRVTASWETDTDVVLVTVRGSDLDGIVEEADAVVAGLQAFYDRQTRAEIEELSEQGDELLSSGALTEPSAEAARRSGVGSALASRQGAAAAGWTTVTLLESAGEAKSTGLSTPIALVLGAFVGAVLSAAAALALPFRRRRVRRASDVAVLLPGVRALPPGDAGAAELAGLFLESECTDLAVVALGGVDEDALYFASDVTVLLRAHGIQATIMDATDANSEDGPGRGRGSDASNLSAYQFLGRAGRAEARGRHAADALVVVTTARTESLSLLTGQSELMAVVAVRARRQRTRAISLVTSQLRHSDPSVVLLP